MTARVQDQHRRPHRGPTLGFQGYCETRTTEDSELLRTKGHNLPTSHRRKKASRFTTVSGNNTKSAILIELADPPQTRPTTTSKDGTQNDRRRRATNSNGSSDDSTGRVVDNCRIRSEVAVDPELLRDIAKRQENRVNRNSATVIKSPIFRNRNKAIIRRTRSIRGNCRRIERWRGRRRRNGNRNGREERVRARRTATHPCRKSEALALHWRRSSWVLEPLPVSPGMGE